MSFQAYLDTIKEKTGKGPDDFIKLAAEKGLGGPDIKAGPVIAWLDQDFGLGRGHAMAIVAVLKTAAKPRASRDERVDRHFGGAKAGWRDSFDRLCAAIGKFGDDVGIAPTDSYLSFTRSKKKFAIAQIVAGHIDIGIKRKGAEPTTRFAEAGNWNTMVTHRTRLLPGARIDAELLDWLRQAYDQAR